MTITLGPWCKELTLLITTTKANTTDIISFLLWPVVLVDCPCTMNLQEFLPNSIAMNRPEYHFQNSNYLFFGSKMSIMLGFIEIACKIGFFFNSSLIYGYLSCLPFRGSISGLCRDWRTALFRVFSFFQLIKSGWTTCSPLACILSFHV